MDLVKHLFSVSGVSSFLSNRLCQDPLEKFFGMQRQRGRANENPDGSTFIKNSQALRVVHGVSGTIKGNCRGTSSQPVDIDLTQPLPKRRKTTNHTLG